MKVGKLKLGLKWLRAVEIYGTYNLILPKSCNYLSSKNEGGESPGSAAFDLFKI